MSYQSTWDPRRDEILAAANRVKTQYPGAWEEVKVPGQTSRRFISLVAAECQRLVSPDIGCNLKRGGPDVSLDVLAMPNASGARDATGTFPGLELRDIIGGAEGPNAAIIWGDATPATIAANVPGGWIKTAGSVPTPQPPVTPYPGDAVWDAVGVVLFADYAAAGQVPNPQMGRWFGRTIWDATEGDAAGVVLTVEASITKHRAEWRAVLGLPPLP